KIEGSFSKGAEEAAEILRVRGAVVPVSEEKMNLFIKLKNKKLIRGESQLDHNKNVRKYGIEKVYLKPNAKAYKKAIDSIMKADMVVIGPGDHYGSIIPNLLVKGIPEALQKTRAVIIYVCNLTNKKGQTENYDLDDYAGEINKYIGKNMISYVISGTKNPDRGLIKIYEEKEGKGSLVLFDPDKGIRRSYKVVKADVLSEKRVCKNKNDFIASTRSFIRHDSDNLAKVIMELSEIEKKKLIKEII
ncbi:MAG: 2-phospho-L-lactate transferase CofD family protein, partial [Candidatus Moranbacteria bacterium]|nr:2-phospho-L-lactate transferase CofD family protein [Candidatus Moranbacteria bacterium]